MRSTVLRKMRWGSLQRDSLQRDSLQRDSLQRGDLRWVGLSVSYSALLLILFLLSTTHLQASPRPSLAPQLAQQEAQVNFSQAAYSMPEDVGVGLVTLEISPVITTPISLIVFSANIQAEAAKDFVGFRQSIVIHPNTSVYTLAVTILDDNFVEADEQFRLAISPLAGGVVGPIAETIITIIENDVAYLGIADAQVYENAGSIGLAITQSLTSTLESLVNVRTIDGSAIASADYEAVVTTISIPPGSSGTTLWIPIYDNAQAAVTKTFTVMLESAVNAQIAVPTATVTIIDDDILPRLTPQSAQALESSGSITFAVSMSKSWEQTVTVAYATFDGSAIAAQDYLAQTGVLSIPPGALTATVTITLFDTGLDTGLDEPNKNFYLLFSDPVQAILTRTEVEGIIGGQSSDSLFMPMLAR